MRQIICIIQNFDIYQTIYVYQNGNKLDMIQVKMDQIPNTIIKFSNMYNIDDVRLMCHPKKYAQKMIEKIQQEELTRYNQHKIKVTLI